MTLIENDSPKVQYTGPFTRGQLLPLTFPYIAKTNVHMLIDGEVAEINEDFEIDTDAASARIKNDLPNAKQITLYRVTPLDQQAPFPQISKFRSERVEQALDKLTMQQQEQEEQLSRCIIAPITLETFNGQLPEPAADQALKWNTDGTELENYDIIGEQEAFEEAVTTQLEEQYTAIENRMGEFEEAITTQLEEQRTATENRMGEFEEAANAQFSDFRNEITENLDAVLDAAGKLEVLDQQVQVAENAASQADAAAARADEAVIAANQAVIAANQAVDQAESAADQAELAADQAESAADQAEEALTEVQEFIQIAEDKYLKTNQITNCITEIPQRIKYTLEDGTLTIKAGSVVTVPNGFEADGTTPKFDYVTVQEDLYCTDTYSYTGNILVMVNANATAIFTERIEIASSGATPGNHDTFGTWYDTTENIIKRTTDNGTTWNGNSSLPIALSSYNNIITSINQVFNGFGYIGSTAWVDKGVKGLIPNGRNEDGTLKNIEYTTPNLIIRTWSYESINQPLFISVDGQNIPSSGAYYVSDVEPVSPTENWIMWYNPRENIMRYSQDNGKWTVYNGWLFTGIYTSSDTAANNYKLTKFTQSKLPVRLVDWNDYQKIEENAVLKDDLAECQVVVETYQNGTSWYRIWSDGWIEQGGHKTSTTVNVTLLKSFANTNYLVLATQAFNDTGNFSEAHPVVYGKTTTSFNLKAQYQDRDYTNQNRHQDWYACGYIA